MVVEQVLAVTSTGVRTKTGNKVAIGNASFSVGEMVAVTDGYVIKHQQVGNSVCMPPKRESSCLYCFDFDANGYLSAVVYDASTLKPKTTITSKTLTKAMLITGRDSPFNRIYNIWQGADCIYISLRTMTPASFSGIKVIKDGEISINTISSLNSVYFDAKGELHAYTRAGDYKYSIISGESVNTISIESIYNRVKSHKSPNQKRDDGVSYSAVHFDGNAVYCDVSHLGMCQDGEEGATYYSWYDIITKNNEVLSISGDYTEYVDPYEYSFKFNDGQVDVTSYYTSGDLCKWNFGGATGDISSSYDYDMRLCNKQHLVLAGNQLTNVDIGKSISYGASVYNNRKGNSNIGISTIGNIKKMLGA